MPTYSLLSLAALRTAVLLGAGLTSLACGREAPGTHARTDQRPPLELSIDSEPIDRNAADRVSYAAIVERTARNVAFVYSSRTVPASRMLPPFLDRPELRRFFGSPGAERLPEQVRRGLGSGVVVSADGYILTNHHVVEDADEVTVSIGDSPARHEARVIGTDALADIAVLKIDARDLAPATLGDSDQLKPGDVVLAIGNPFGVGLSVSRGIVSALSRGNLGIEQIEDFIQTDAAINTGNSGGALIDSSGRVVGINTAILSRTGGFAGVGFAIPINLVRSVAEQIVDAGEVRRGFLGVAPQPLTPGLARQFGTSRGALIAEVTPGSAAETAGLAAGDIITQIDGTDIRDPRHLLLTVSQLAPETRVEVAYLRDGKERTATAILERRPEQSLAGDMRREGTRDEGVLDGVAVGDLTPPLRDRLQIPARVEGAVVTRVDPSSAAARQGLREGDVILELGRERVRNASEAVRRSGAMKGPQVLVRIWREGRSRFLVIDESSGERR